MQITLGQVPEQGVRFGLPGAEQAVDAKETLVTGFLPELAKDAQACVAAVANDEVRLIRSAGNCRRLIQATFTD
ncbi:hypothetical protein D3C80_2035900 [compost metagenome]